MDKSKVTIVSEVSSITLSSLGYVVSVTEIMEYIFLILTILSLSVSILSNIIVSVVKVINRKKELTKDGEMSINDMTELTTLIKDELKLTEVEVNKLKGVIEHERQKKVEKSRKNRR